MPWFQDAGIIESWAKIVTATANAAPTIVPVTIASGTSLSAAIPTNGMRPYSLIMPPAWDNSDVSFQLSFDGSNFMDLWVSSQSTADNTTVTVPVFGSGAGRPNIMSVVGGWQAMHAPWLKLQSGKAGSLVNQTADRVVQVMFFDWNANPFI
jgi:hypothetical protein